MPSRFRLTALFAILSLFGVMQVSLADSGPSVPVASGPAPRGTGTWVNTPPSVPSIKTVDGLLDDWQGHSSRYGGTSSYSGGELIYQDYINDAYGADDGRDAARVGLHDQLVDPAPQSYRSEPLVQYVPAELGVPVPVAQLQASMNYGNFPHQDEADLEELRFAADSSNLYVLARTTTMKSPVKTGLLLLIDNADGGNHAIGFNAHLSSESADLAVLITSSQVLIQDLSTSEITTVGAAAANASAFNNAIEAAIPLSALGDVRSIGAATGITSTPSLLADVTPGNSIANVAFRSNEPVRGNWFDKLQSLALFNHNIDQFFVPLDVAGMQAGIGRTYMPGPGYHSRIFVSSETISTEGGEGGIFQHYGLYIPTSYKDLPTPLQFWLHWRGGRAHTGAAVSPRIFQHFGEDQDTIVVSPNGRGTSRWYIGKGHVDFLEVWEDVMSAMNIDKSRVYVSGHSMGGFGSYLLTILYPDRFAAAAPVSGPVTQGAWTGLDFPGCDSFRSGEYSPCYVQANGGNARVQHTRRLLENLRNVPWAILTGNADELVPYSGVALQATRLAELGYRYRLYSFPNYEHYSLPLVDEWAEAARYEHQFTRPLNPPRVSYIRDMPFERTVETLANDGVSLNFDFNKAYWMSELTPADLVNGVARFEGTSLAISDPARLTIPEVGGPAAIGQTGPFDMTGLRWLDDPIAAVPLLSNAFEATLTGVSAVKLDLARMSLNSAMTLGGTVTSNGGVELRLLGSWSSLPTVTVNGNPAPATMSDGVLKITLPSGTSSIVIG